MNKYLNININKQTNFAYDFWAKVKALGVYLRALFSVSCGSQYVTLEQCYMYMEELSGKLGRDDWRGFYILRTVAVTAGKTMGLRRSCYDNM